MDAVKRYSSFYRGIVKDNKDPKSLKRLKVIVPQVTGEQVTEWIWPNENASISSDMPVIGQGVWVSYTGGDPDYPLWNGTFGKHQGKSKKIFVKPLLDSVNISTLTSYVKTVKQADGTTEVDLTATLIAMANALKDHETRIASLESQLTTLHTTLATRTSPSHTHGSNG